jgi:hypothetical protein
MAVSKMTSLYNLEIRPDSPKTKRIRICPEAYHAVIAAARRESASVGQYVSTLILMKEGWSLEHINQELYPTKHYRRTFRN